MWKSFHQNDNNSIYRPQDPLVDLIHSDGSISSDIFSTPKHPAKVTKHFPLSLSRRQVPFFGVEIEQWIWCSVVSLPTFLEKASMIIPVQAPVTLPLCVYVSNLQLLFIKDSSQVPKKQPALCINMDLIQYPPLPSPVWLPRKWKETKLPFRFSL